MARLPLTKIIAPGHEKPLHPLGLLRDEGPPAAAKPSQAKTNGSVHFLDLKHSDWQQIRLDPD